MRSYISRHSIVYTIYPRKLTLVKPNQLVESDSSRSRDLSSAICCPNLLQLFPCLPFFFFSSLYFFPITNFIASITLLVHQASFLSLESLLRPHSFPAPFGWFWDHIFCVQLGLTYTFLRETRKLGAQMAHEGEEESLGTTSPLGNKFCGQLWGE